MGAAVVVSSGPARVRIALVLRWFRGVRGGGLFHSTAQQRCYLSSSRASPQQNPGYQARLPSEPIGHKRDVAPPRRLLRQTQLPSQLIARLEENDFMPSLRAHTRCLETSDAASHHHYRLLPRVDGAILLVRVVRPG